MAQLSSRASEDSNGNNIFAKTSARPWTPMPIGRWRKLDAAACGTSHQGEWGIVYDVLLRT
eukprot:CAMPEP_0181181372 /NCGR_PEP_ID=MMETSP1096-20121128/7300_1 /TAXON_ID=156174 ORGANISM="Chrysochromulina ericina, Strain CCMP281" /NCGR_SAMPLE_ID=MMETSP1096 /ASSEMBLY_ACC=CAM_ASM_000453 /LENGTH=60 /DNA_ID=CAMNT_0023269867 /DNA_START=893 /DNA_END=1075 /DNA_ORIENTATION=+